MSKGLKVGLIIIGCLMVTCFGGGYIFFRNFVQPTIQQGQAAFAEGKSYAANTDNAGCLTQARSRVQADSGMASSIAQSFFLQGCLESSRPTAGFCDSIPAPRDSTRGTAWLRERCPGSEATAPRCMLIEAQLQSFCHPTGRG